MTASRWLPLATTSAALSFRQAEPGEAKLGRLFLIYRLSL